MMYAKVIVGLNNPAMDKMFDYAVPEGMEVRQGGRVIVPFGRRNAKAEGYVISLSEETDVPEDKIKSIAEVLDEGKPTFTPQLMELAKWMQERYFCTLNQCLQAIMPVTRGYAARPIFLPDHMAMMNERIRALAVDEHFRYIDPREWCADEEGFLLEEYTNDGCHPDAKGCEAWATWLLEKAGWLNIP